MTNKKTSEPLMLRTMHGWIIPETRNFWTPRQLTREVVVRDHKENDDPTDTNCWGLTDTCNNPLNCHLCWNELVTISAGMRPGMRKRFMRDAWSVYPRQFHNFYKDRKW